MVAVLAFHAALIVAFVKFDRLPNAATLTSNPIQVRSLSPATAADIRSESPAESSLRGFAVPTPILPSLTLVPMVSSEGDSNNSVDWAAEAKIVAAATAEGSTQRSFGVHVPSAAASSAGAGPATSPTHQAGDQYMTDTGEWIVFVSKNCYQISNGIPNMFGSILRAMPLQTYCLGKSKGAPRGDLFEQLPAYKKNHPDN
jgi:hypothetical protein